MHRVPSPHSSPNLRGRTTELHPTRSVRTRTISNFIAVTWAKSWEEAKIPRRWIRSDCRRYSAWLAGRGYAPSTIARRLASLRSFFRFLRREGLVAADPAAGLRNPKQPKRLPRLLRVDDEVIRLLDGVPVETLAGVRDRAMLETLYGGGLRVSELVGMNVDDLDCREHERLVRVLGKGRHGERLCPVGGVWPPRWLRRWITLRQPKAPQERAMFLNQRGGRLTTRSVGRLLQAHLLRAGLLDARPVRTATATLTSSPTCSMVGPISHWRPGAAGAPQSDHSSNFHPRHTGPDSRYLSHEAHPRA